jgi:hypothetical protein
VNKVTWSTAPDSWTERSPGARAEDVGDQRGPEDRRALVFVETDAAGFEMLTIVPLRWARMPGTTRWMSWATPKTLTSNWPDLGSRLEPASRRVGKPPASDEGGLVPQVKAVTPLIGVLFTMWVIFAAGWAAVHQTLVVMLIRIVVYAVLTARTEDSGQIPNPVDNPPGQVGFTVHPCCVLQAGPGSRVKVPFG